MMIGIVTTMNALSWAGSEELWYGAAQELLDAGHDVCVYYPAVRGWAPQLALAGTTLTIMSGLGASDTRHRRRHAAAGAMV